MKLYNLIVDGVEYRSSSPLTEEIVRKKMKAMTDSKAFNVDDNCETCKEQQNKEESS